MAKTKAKKPRNRKLLRRGLFFIVSILAIASCFEGWAAFRVSRVKPFIIVPSEKIAPVFFRATIAMEDGRYYQHGAFDSQAINHAIQINLREKRIVHGGSTITQQLAKNLFLSKQRTFGRKFLELFLAIELERQYGKSRIIEIYVNNIDYGMGQHGIKDASEFYFHKSTDKLTLAESAILVGIVPYSPQKWPDRELIEIQRSKAIDRISYWYPNEYSQLELDAARNIPLRTLLPDLPP